jgi:acetylornithine deacetylase/succinyl-diaminopimelate desuccinylase-like protein
LLNSGHRFDLAINTENSGNAIVPRWVGRAEAQIQVRARAGGRELHFHFKEVDPSIRSHKSVFEQTRRILDALGPEMAAPTEASWMSFSGNDGLPGYPQFRIERITTRSQMVVDVDLQIRTVPGQTEASIRRDLEGCLERLASADRTFDAELRFPMAPIRSAVDVADDDPLVQALAAAYAEVAGTRPTVSAQGRLGAAADASVLVEHGVKTVIFGPGGGVSDVAYQAAVHRGEVPPDERISISDIVLAARVYAGTAMALSQ